MTTEKPDPHWTPASPATPELDRQARIIESGEAALIQKFIDWMTLVNGWSVCHYEPNAEMCSHADPQYGGYISIQHGPQAMMEMFFDIDPKKIEKERRLLLDHIRSREPALANESDANIAAMGASMDEGVPEL